MDRSNFHSAIHKCIVDERHVYSSKAQLINSSRNCQDILHIDCLYSIVLDMDTQNVLMNLILANPVLFFCCYMNSTSSLYILPYWSYSLRTDQKPNNHAARLECRLRVQWRRECRERNWLVLWIQSLLLRSKHTSCSSNSYSLC